MKPGTSSRYDRIVDDLRSGENIDLYASVVVAFALIVLNIFGVIDQKFFVPVSMGVLAILTYTIVSLRHDIAELRNCIQPKSQKPQFTSNFPPEFQSQLDAAHDIWFSGTHLSSAITAYYELLRCKLERGGKLRFLLVDPEGQAAIMASKRFPGNVSSDQERARINASLAMLTELASTNPDTVEIRVIDFPIEYTTFFLDPYLPSAVMYVERSTYKTSGGIHKPKFVFHRGDGRWFEHMEKEVKLLWDDATTWRCPSNSHSPVSAQTPQQPVMPILH